MRINAIQKRIMLLLAVLTIPVTVYWFELSQLKASRQPQHTLLQKVGDECAGIADNAVANLTAVVEFQKLEIQGRKFNVMRRCMTDQGFVENPDWRNYATPIAQSASVQQGISVDEAIENLRRVHMMIFHHVAHQPIYWVPHP